MLRTRPKWTSIWIWVNIPRRSWRSLASCRLLLQTLWQFLFCLHLSCPGLRPLCCTWVTWPNSTNSVQCWAWSRSVSWCRSTPSRTSHSGPTRSVWPPTCFRPPVWTWTSCSTPMSSWRWGSVPTIPGATAVSKALGLRGSVVRFPSRWFWTPWCSWSWAWVSWLSVSFCPGRGCARVHRGTRFGCRAGWVGWGTTWATRGRCRWGCCLCCRLQCGFRCWTSARRICWSTRWVWLACSCGLTPPVCAATLPRFGRV